MLAKVIWVCECGDRESSYSFPVIFIQFFFFCNSLHLSVKDVTEILKLLILILELFPKLRKYIRYFRRGNDTGSDSTTNNKMGIESYNSIEAFTSAVNWRSSCITLSYYYLEFHAFFYIFFILRLSSIRKHGDWWGVFFFLRERQVFLGAVILSL